MFSKIFQVMIESFKVKLSLRPNIHKCIFSILCNMGVMICLNQGGLLSPIECFI